MIIKFLTRSLALFSLLQVFMSCQENHHFNKQEKIQKKTDEQREREKQKQKIIHIPMHAILQNNHFSTPQNNKTQLEELLRNIKKSVDPSSWSYTLYEDVGLVKIDFFISSHSNFEKDLFLKDTFAQLDNQFIFSEIHPQKVHIKKREALKEFDTDLSSLENSTKRISSREDFMGHKQLRLREFIHQFQEDVKAETGISENIPFPDGSSVRVGITDTGISVNHPIFRSDKDKENKKHRVIYMNDFTREGIVYFTKDQLAIGRTLTAPELKELPPLDSANHYISLSGSVIAPQVGAANIGQIEETPIQDLVVAVDEKLKDKLLLGDGSILLGVFSEKAYMAAVGEEKKEVIDINHNYKYDENFLVILDTTEEKLHIDLTGKNNFTQNPPLRDWNKYPEDLIASGKEKIGFVFKREIRGDDTELYSAAMVGMDPGNHGTHVAGIATGGKLFKRESDDTLARGIAMEASIMANRVCSNNNGCYAIDAVIDLARKGADVINMSLGGLSNLNDGTDVESLLIDRLSDIYNVQFMISAGNSGPGIQTIGHPSTSERALSIGATATPRMMMGQLRFPAWPGSELDDDFMMYFSSRGPHAAFGLKPNLAAPGSQLSSIQLNGTYGSRSSLDQYWGTSMAAPAATGSYAVLLDAVRKFNTAIQKKEGKQARLLPTDSFFLKAVLLESARAFSPDRYTWIDYGMGIVDLEKSWNLLMEIYRSNNNLEGSFKTAKGQDIHLNYNIRTTGHQARNNIDYDGSLVLGRDGQKMMRYGRGIWIEHYGEEKSSYKIFIERDIPARYAQDDKSLSELEILRDNSEDIFLLETQFQGTDKPWATVTELISPNCQDFAPLEEVAISSSGLNDWSSLHLCVNREIVKTLPPGDYGILIKGYRVDTSNNLKSPLASFVVPVYLTVPHLVLSHKDQTFGLSGEVKSFEVKRHYLEIPSDITSMRLSVSIPPYAPPKNLCSAIKAFVYEGKNIVRPEEFTKNGVAKNCENSGNPLVNGSQEISFERISPNPGIWEVHLLGHFLYPLGQYEIKLDYNKTQTTINEISGDISALDGHFAVNTLESTTDPKANNGKSTFHLQGTIEKGTFKIKNKEEKFILSALQFDEEVSLVNLTINENQDNRGQDLDLFLYLCESPNFSKSDGSCSLTLKSAGGTSQESIEFAPKADKFYFAEAVGYEMDETKEDIPFEFEVKRHLAHFDVGNLEISEDGSDIHYTLNPALTSQRKEFVERRANLFGEVILRNTLGYYITRIPVLIHPIK